jgi:nucleotide-binding universal stress UspA family protein
MYRYILIPTDGTELAEKAVTAGTDYARETGARVLFFTAMPAYQMPSEAQMMARQHVTSVAAYEEEAAHAARAILDKASRQAKEANVAFETEFDLSDKPSQAIIDAAKRHGCDAIFMASHARTGIPALWYGSETRDVLTHSDIPTLVYR